MANESVTAAMSDFRAGHEPQPSDVFIAVMGVTGSGKSTFISHCVDEEVIIGHNLESCTQEVQVYRCNYRSQRNVYLIDTPGFDDTDRKDSDVLKEIAFWLADSFSNEVKLTGIIYLHRISERRMQGSAKKNLFMFRKLCGTDALKNVILVTTMWEDVKLEDGERRELELRKNEEFWGWMIYKGSDVIRHYNTQESAMKLIDKFASPETNMSVVELSIQHELVTDGRQLDQTMAGQELGKMLAAERAKAQKELEELRKQMTEELAMRDKEAAQNLEEQQQEMTKKIKALQEERENLKITMENLHKEKLSRYQEQLETLRNQRTRTRSTPGANKVSKTVMLSLSGGNYSFIGKSSSLWSVSETIKFDLKGYDDLRVSANGKRKLKAIALGVEKSVYIHFHEKKRCMNYVNDNFKEHYPAFARGLDIDFEMQSCPFNISLGDSGKYFLRTQSGTKFYSDSDLISSLHSDRTLRRFWWGYNGSWVVERESFSGLGLRIEWDLKGFYPALQEYLREGIDKDNSIRDLALNIENPSSFVVVFGSGKVVYSGGSDVGIPGFDEFFFEEFATRNFGSQFTGPRSSQALSVQENRLYTEDNGEITPSTGGNVGSLYLTTRPGQVGFIKIKKGLGFVNTVLHGAKPQHPR